MSGDDSETEMDTDTGAWQRTGVIADSRVVQGVEASSKSRTMGTERERGHGFSSVKLSAG